MFYSTLGRCEHGAIVKLTFFRVRSEPFLCDSSIQKRTLLQRQSGVLYFAVLEHKCAFRTELP